MYYAPPVVGFFMRAHLLIMKYMVYNMVTNTVQVRTWYLSFKQIVFYWWYTHLTCRCVFDACLSNNVIVTLC